MSELAELPEEETEELLLETEALEEEVAQDEPDSEESIVTFGDEPEDVEEETPLIKKLRATIRENKRKLRQFEQGSVPAKAKIELGPEPTFEDPDVDYDPDKLKAKLVKWMSDKAEIERAEREEAEARQRADATWQTELASYEKKKAMLAIADKEEAEEEAISKLSQIQQAIIVKHENGAAIMVALGKYPKKLSAVSAVEDPVKFAYAISDIGRELKVIARKKAPEPDAPLRSDAPLSGAQGARDKQRNAILDKMAQGGDVTKLRAQLKALDSRH